MRSLVLVALGTLAIACGGSPPPPANPAPPPRAAPPPAPPPPAAPAADAPPPLPPPPSLASRLGDHDGIARLVHATLERVRTDRRVSRMLRGPNRDEVEARMVTLLCTETGGDCPADGPSLELAHWGQNVTDRQFDAFLEDLTAAMTALGIEEVEQNELLAVVGPLRARVVPSTPVDRPGPRR